MSCFCHVSINLVGSCKDNDMHGLRLPASPHLKCVTLTH